MTDNRNVSLEKILAATEALAPTTIKESFMVRSNDSIAISTDTNASSIITGLAFEQNTSGWQLESALGGVRNISGRTLYVNNGDESAHITSGSVTAREIFSFLERGTDGIIWVKVANSGKRFSVRGTSDQYGTRDSEAFSVLNNEIIRPKYFADGADETINQVSFVADGDTVLGPSFRWRLEEV